MPEIYLVRHGQTAWNAAMRLQGQEDTPLNEKGRGQARRNGAALAETLSNPDAFDYVASPLNRTCETMEIIRAALSLPVESYRTDAILKEINFGDWQGRTWEQLREANPQQIATRFDDPWNTVAPGVGGESFKMLSKRALGWLKTVERDTVAVTHGGIIRCVIGHIEQIPEAKIPRINITQDRIYALGENRVELI